MKRLLDIPCDEMQTNCKEYFVYVLFICFIYVFPQLSCLMKCDFSSFLYGLEWAKTEFCF